MEKMHKNLKKKIRSQAGESLTETLVALLISALAIVMLAGAMTTATGVITESQKKLDDYYKAAESVVNRTSTETGTKNITINDTTSKSITYYKNSEFTKTPVITYKMQ